MAVRLRYRIEAPVSSTPSETKDLGNARFEVVSDHLGEGGSWKTLLESGASEVQLYMGNIESVKFLLIRTAPRNQNVDPVDVEIRLNDLTTDSIVISPLSGAREGHLLLCSDGISAVYASNMGGVDMEITVVAAGD